MKDTDTTDTSVVTDTGTSDPKGIQATDSAEPNGTSDTTDTTDTETDDTIQVQIHRIQTPIPQTHLQYQWPTHGPACTGPTLEKGLPRFKSPLLVLPVPLLSLGHIVAYTYLVSFAGTAGSPASHEGLNYVHIDANVGVVPIYASGAGTVVYVRTGCPQSSEFALNNDLRECGSGWGNHVVIDHGNQIYTRYAHLKPNTVSVSVGTVVSEGQYISDMGNSGRSDLRHLHFELGTKTSPFDPLALSQSFDLVYNPRNSFELVLLMRAQCHQLMDAVRHF